jgi:hypothetical protein
VNVKGFFVATLSSALDLGIASPDDVIRHVTPDVLAAHLPRPLWARLLTAALGAPKVDAQLVVETIGVPNLCEHVPSTIIWACIAEIAQRSLAGVPLTRPATVTPPVVSKSQPVPLAAPPPPELKRDTPPRGTPLPAAAPSIPKPTDGLADVVAALESDERQISPSGRSRSPTGPRFRQSSTNVGRLGSLNNRRPQAPVGGGAREAGRGGGTVGRLGGRVPAGAPRPDRGRRVRRRDRRQGRLEELARRRGRAAGRLAGVRGDVDRRRGIPQALTGAGAGQHSSIGACRSAPVDRRLSIGSCRSARVDRLAGADAGCAG